MKKKILLVAVILCIFTVSQVHSFGVGAQANFYADFGEEGMYAPGFSLLLSPSRTFNIAANYYIDVYSDSIVGLTMDFVPTGLVFNISRSGMTLLANPKAWAFNFNLGLGGFFNIRFAEFFNFQDEVTVAGGVRFPIGFNFLFAGHRFEIFTHVAPSLGINLSPKFEFSNPFFPVALGARLWVK